MTTRTYSCILFVLLVMCLDLVLQADTAHANFVIPAFDVTENDVGQEGINMDVSVTVDSSGAAHFIWNHTLLGLQTRKRMPDGSLGPIQKLAESGWDTRAAADGAGNVHFVWTGPTGPTSRTVRADGTLGETVDFSTDVKPYQPEIAGDPDGGVTFVWKALTGDGPFVQGRRMAPDGTLGPVENISPGGDVAQHQVAVDEEGNAVIVWLRHDGSYWVARARQWAADGSLGPIISLSTTGADANWPRVAFDAAGQAHIALLRGSALLARRLGPDGVLAPSQDIRALPGDTADSPDVAVAPSGEAQVVWRAVSAQGGNLIQTRHEHPDGSYGPVQNLAHYAGKELPRPAVAFDSQGAANHVWTTEFDSKAIVMARAREPNGSLGTLQQLSGTTAPFEGGAAWYLTLAGPPNGDPIAAWTQSRTNSPAITVQGAAVGAPKPGDGDGSGGGASSDGATATGTDPHAGGTGAGMDQVAPALSGLALRPAKLVMRRRGRVSYALSEPAKVVLRVVRRGTGRPVGAIHVNGRAGRNSLTFSGRLRGRWLRPTRYVFVAVATDAAGNRSAPRRERFRVVRRPR